MSRKKKNDIEIINSEDINKQLNTLQEYTTVTEGFLAKIFNSDIIRDVKAEDLVKYFSDPEKYHEEIERLAQYNYISNGDIFQLFDLTRVLPTLNHKIETDTKNKSYEKNLSTCNKVLNNVGHKQLTRDLISQTITSGTLTAIWLGDKKNPYLYVFDNLEYAFPAYRKNGRWVVWVDLKWFDLMSETERDVQLENLSPYVSMEDYKNYQKDSSTTRYIELPLERGVVLRTHTLKRNQRLGMSWYTPGALDLVHKKKLKDLEKSIANKIINSVAVLTIGSDSNENYSNMRLNKNLKKKVYGGVKTALEKNNEQGVTVIAIPEYAKIEFPNIKSDGLDPKKFETIDDDIASGYGFSRSITAGNGGSFSSGKLNLDILYKRIGELLELIETEVYQRLFDLVLPNQYKDEYHLVYDKEIPITQKEKLDTLLKLHNMEGFALKSVIDMLSGIEWNSYIEQSLHEQETMKLQEKIKPYASAYIGNNQNPNGRPNVENPQELSGKTDGQE